MGVRQGCPLSPTLFGLFFDGLHDHVRAALPTAGLQLHSGRCVPFLCYADDVVLMAESAMALQRLIDGMHDFCDCAGLTISVAKTEVVVSHFMGWGSAGCGLLVATCCPAPSLLNTLGWSFMKVGRWMSCFSGCITMLWGLQLDLSPASSSWAVPHFCP